jgi:NADH:ubiquinone oxidoreductase subunit 6 (subunit J)
MIFFFFLSLFLLTFILITPNIMHGLLGLILLFGNFALFLFLLDLPFLGFAYIIVYIGAICVLFLYIILLLNLRIYPLIMRSSFYFASLIGILFVTTIISTLFFSKSLLISPYKYSIIPLEDLTLYTQYLFEAYPLYLLVAIFLLLVALIIALSTTSTIAYIDDSRKLSKKIYNHINF